MPSWADGEERWRQLHFGESIDDSRPREETAMHALDFKVLPLARYALADYAMSREARQQEVDLLAQAIREVIAAHLEALGLDP